MFNQKISDTKTIHKVVSGSIETHIKLLKNLKLESTEILKIRFLGLFLSDSCHIKNVRNTALNNK